MMNGIGKIKGKIGGIKERSNDKVQSSNEMDSVADIEFQTWKFPCLRQARNSILEIYTLIWHLNLGI